jgi:hypothetical protein
MNFLGATERVFAEVRGAAWFPCRTVESHLSYRMSASWQVEISKNLLSSLNLTIPEGHDTAEFGLF